MIVSSLIFWLHFTFAKEMLGTTEKMSGFWLHGIVRKIFLACVAANQADTVSYYLGIKSQSVVTTKHFLLVIQKLALNIATGDKGCFKKADLQWELKLILLNVGIIEHFGFNISS